MGAAEVERLRGYGRWQWLVFAVVAHEAAIDLGLLLLRGQPEPLASLMPQTEELFDAPPVERLAAPTPKDVTPPPPTPLDETFKRPVVQSEDDPYSGAIVPEATKVLTRDGPGGVGFATGEGNGPGYGLVAGAGTGTAVLVNVRIPPPPPPQLAPPPPPPQPAGPDRSRPARVASVTTDDCPRPPDSGDQQVLVKMVVAVRADGSAESAIVIQSPNQAFASVARTCALRHKYQPARDRNGNSIPALTAPFNVHFY